MAGCATSAEAEESKVDGDGDRREEVDDPGGGWPRVERRVSRGEEDAPA